MIPNFEPWRAVVRRFQVEMEDPATNETASLFPVFIPGDPPKEIGSVPDRKPTMGSAKWLQNSSFTTDISVIDEAISKYELPIEKNQRDSEEEDAKELDDGKRPPQYEIVPSSPSGCSGSSEEYDAKKGKRKKQKRKVEYSGSFSSHGRASTFSSSSRKPAVQKWANSSTYGDKVYRFDSRGDPDNLAFGSTYRMDVAHYKLFNSSKASMSHYFKRNKNAVFLEGDVDLDSLDSKLKSGGRYWSPKYATIERHKNLKRLRVLPRRNQGSSPTADFIPLCDEVSVSAQVADVTMIEESWEDESLRKTKEFNKLTRERPHDESLWMEFAKFQDKVAGMQPHKGARLQTLEKKISILENATALNPESEDLLLCLMKAYSKRDSPDALMKRWENALTLNSGSCKLWKEFLRVVQGEFSRFNVSDMRKIYASAIQALSGACIKQHRQADQSSKHTLDAAFIQLELGLVDVFISLCHLEWQAGYQEMATALFQAEIEFSLFCPLGLSEQSKKRLFEHFWSGDGARIGHDGALGWSTWLQKEEEQRQKLMNEESLGVEDECGWSGWFKPSSNDMESEGLESAAPQNDDFVDEESHESSSGEDDEQKDDVESLLKALGIDAAAEADIKITDARTWTKWSEEELARDINHWMPLQKNSGKANSEDGSDLKDDEQLLSIILYEEVCDYMFSLNSEEAQLSLIFQFIDFYEGRIPNWTCTNSSNWVDKMLSMESIPCSLMEDMRNVHGVLGKKIADPLNFSFETILNSSEELSKGTDMMKFIRNVALLCLNAFPRNHMLEEVALISEELSNTDMCLSKSSVTPCRALAKSLLKNNREDILLCGVYARREAYFGNIDHSRKVFEMALQSTEKLAASSRSNASLLYFWYAEMELANSQSRALHILSRFGSGAIDFPFNDQISSLQQLRARQGFKDRIKLLSANWSRGIIDDHDTALICSAALFEELTSGLASGLEILEHSFTMVLPERRRQSKQLEFLFQYYVDMLFRNRMQLKISKVWEDIEKGLQIYPFNPNIHGVLLEIGYLHTSPNKLRCTLDDCTRKRPSIVTYLYALLFEMSTGGSKHRIRALFERAIDEDTFHHSVILWRYYVGFERSVTCDFPAAKRVFFRAIHACPWSKKLWLDGFRKLESILTVKELSDLQEVMRDKGLNLRTDIYEILLQDDAMDTSSVPV